MPSKKPIIAIRTTDEIIEKFQKICDEESRSMSNLGELLIKKYIKEWEEKQERTEHKEKLEKSSISKTG